MADRPSRDRSGDRAIAALHDEQAAAAAAGQALADRDQTLSDTDQTGSDRDQTAADRDQAASDRDQAASDRDLDRGGDQAEHQLTRHLRDRSAEERHRSARARVEEAVDRDAAAQTRDVQALERDRLAALHDSKLAARETARGTEGRIVSGAEIVPPAAEQRRLAASDRVAATEGRARAAAERERAGHDRDQAAGDRQQAYADREALLAQLALAETDPVTGARTRHAGIADLDHEIQRAHRTTGVLTVVYVDLVGLKAINDNAGHAAGDALLRGVVTLIREHLRSYDMIVRLGGDEFLCAMSNMPAAEARRRFRNIATALNETPQARVIRTGFAELEPGDRAHDLIARADHELINSGSKPG